MQIDGTAACYGFFIRYIYTHISHSHFSFVRIVMRRHPQLPLSIHPSARFCSHIRAQKRNRSFWRAAVLLKAAAAVESTFWCCGAPVTDAALYRPISPPPLVYTVPFSAPFCIFAPHFRLLLVCTALFCASRFVPPDIVGG